ncbi:TetR/AcrR family transcriptional regulator [Crassaminicella profunda]|nr:TetR/AcrR family transcriptional regulator [Crassaminicella profunda]
MDKMDHTRKEELLEAALDEFINNTYDEASLNNILKKVNMSKGAFYYRFKNKKELYLYLCEKVQKEKLEYINKWLLDQAIDYNNLSIFELLHLQGRAGFEFGEKYIKYLKLGQRFMSEENPEIKKYIYEKIKNTSENIFDPIIERGIARGELRDDFSKSFIKKILYHSMFNYTNILLDDYEALSLEEQLESFHHFIDFLKNGLSKKEG